MPVQFAFTLFVSAALLFMVQPMIGRLVLPLVGGSPAAWNTCMVFFQTLLLLGYAYAHALTTRLTSRKQLTVHASVLAIALFVFAEGVFFGPTHSPIPIFKSLAPQGTEYPMFGMLSLLAVAIGIPFFVVSTSAPLLQKWFSVTGHPSARDPYFLYAASNAGSLISLLGYPILIEPNLTLSQQQWVWAIGFVFLFVLTVACGRHAAHPLPIAGVTESTEQSTAKPPSRIQIMKWVALAFVPSSLMLGVTFHMTTDITSIPLLWVPPLALYLLTFIIAFARLPRWFRPLVGNIAPVGLLLLVFVLCSSREIGANDDERAFVWLGLHIGVYFLIALMCHTDLAYERPKSTKYLTSYYLWMSFGGMLGGIFNALVAPMIFPSNYEYPIAIAVAAFLVPVFGGFADSASSNRSTLLRKRILDVVVPVAMLIVCGILAYMIREQYFESQLESTATFLTNKLRFNAIQIDIQSDTVGAFISFALPCMAAFFCIDRPTRFGLCVVAILIVGMVKNERVGSLETHRSFFGILKASDYKTRNKLSGIFYEKPGDTKDDPQRLAFETEHFIQLVHGTTLHGTQATKTWTYPVRDDLSQLGHSSPWTAMLVAGSMQAFDMRQEPLTYYHRTGPVGEMFKETYRRVDRPKVAMVGLGSGSVACYARKDLPFTFYEIDPAVLKIVDKEKPKDPEKASKQFTYLADARARGAKVEIVLGDARLKLEEQTDRKYDLLLIDAFSSDSIPVHLLTKQAVQLYTERLAPGGLLGLHISNKYISLSPVVAGIARELGLASRIFSDHNGSYSGKTTSSWCVLAKSEADLGNLGLSRIDHGEAPATVALLGGAIYSTYSIPWKPLVLHEEISVWTDDYADVLSVMKLKEIQNIRRMLGQPTVAGED
ncbi:MAG: hypothetical protein U0798_09340 [Gemmataceae bacterium]